jgi:hypothetical protein
VRRRGTIRPSLTSALLALGLLAAPGLTSCAAEPDVVEAVSCLDGPGLSPAPGVEGSVAGFGVSGLRPGPVTPDYYAVTERTLVDLDDPAVDADGALVSEATHGRGPDYHPVALAQYGLATLSSYELTGDPEYLRRALATATRLLDGATTADDGALWFAYPFEYSMHGDESMTLEAPWYSGMAQGQGLSLFTRLAARTGDPLWADAAEQTFRTFEVEGPSGGDASTPWFVHVDESGCLWFEEYVGSVEPVQVVNGHIYATFGLYDYARLTDDEAAVELFDGAATTVLHSFGAYRARGDVSYYCAGQYCKDREWQPGSYHRGVVRQVETLALMTSDRAFLDRAVTLRADYEASGSTD